MSLSEDKDRKRHKRAKKFFIAHTNQRIKKRNGPAGTRARGFKKDPRSADDKTRFLASKQGADST